MTEIEFKNRFQYNPSTDLLGSGGFAEVFKVFDKTLNKIVALKIYKEKFSNKYDLISEKKRTEGIEHENLCKYYDVFELKVTDSLNHESTRQYAVVEYMNAGTLNDYINEYNPDIDTKKKLFIDILHGLECLHSNGIIHRDIKPENILVNIPVEGLPIAKITDFGISKKVDDVSKKSSQLFGASCYMAPEQFDPIKFGQNGEINTNVDLWAFGMVVYESITGNRLIQSTTDNIDVALKDIEAFDLKRIEELEQPYQFLVKNCLIKDARERVKTASELIEIFTVIPTINFKNNYTNKFDNQFKAGKKRKLSLAAMASIFLCLLLLSTGLVFRNEISDFFNPSRVYVEDAESLFKKGYSLYESQQYDSSFYYFAKSDALGSPKGQFMLGEHYIKGYGVKANLDSAEYFYTKAASQDFADAFVRLGDIACKENRLPDALSYYNKASEKGYNGDKELLDKKKQEIAQKLGPNNTNEPLKGKVQNEEIKPVKRDCPDCDDGTIYIDVPKLIKCERGCTLGRIKRPCSNRDCDDGTIAGERKCTNSSCDDGREKRKCYKSKCDGGYVEVNCEDCRGDGIVTGCVRCNACGGSGFSLNMYGFRESCRNCNGNGQVKASYPCDAGCERGKFTERCPQRCEEGYRYSTCSTCDGDGVEDYTKKCNRCKKGWEETECPGRCNSGEVTTIQQEPNTCKRCKGSGAL